MQPHAYAPFLREKKHLEWEKKFDSSYNILTEICAKSFFSFTKCSRKTFFRFIISDSKLAWVWILNILKTKQRLFLRKIRIAFWPRKWIYLWWKGDFYFPHFQNWRLETVLSFATNPSKFKWLKSHFGDQNKIRTAPLQNSGSKNKNVAKTELYTCQIKRRKSWTFLSKQHKFHFHFTIAVREISRLNFFFSQTENGRFAKQGATFIYGKELVSELQVFAFSVSRFYLPHTTHIVQSAVYNHSPFEYCIFTDIAGHIFLQFLRVDFVLLWYYAMVDKKIGLYASTIDWDDFDWKCYSRSKYCARHDWVAVSGQSILKGNLSPKSNGFTPDSITIELKFKTVFTILVFDKVRTACHYGVWICNRFGHSAGSVHELWRRGFTFDNVFRYGSAGNIGIFKADLSRNRNQPDLIEGIRTGEIVCICQVYGHYSIRFGSTWYLKIMCILLNLDQKVPFWMLHRRVLLQL